MATADRKLLGLRSARAAARLSLIVLLAAGLTTLTVIAAPARADKETATAAKAAGLSSDVLVPVGEEMRGGDYGTDWQHCVQVVANLRADHPTVPLVVLLGGSAARECTVLDTNWERQIKRRSGYVVDAYNLGSKHRTYAQDLAFVKLLPSKVDTIVYVGINLGRFCRPVTSASIKLPKPKPLGRYHQHVYSKKRIQSAATKRTYVSSWLTARYPEFRVNYKREVVMLEKIIRACKRRHFRVALLDLPRDLPAIGSSFAVPVSRYQRACARLARAWRIPWLHFVAAAHLANRDFFDIFHLVEPGRVKYQGILSKRTIRLLEKYHMPSPTPTPTPTPTASPSASASPTETASPAASD